jgi:hypothetical protein
VEAPAGDRGFYELALGSGEYSLCPAVPSAGAVWLLGSCARVSVDDGVARFDYASGPDGGRWLGVTPYAARTRQTD